MIYPIVIYGSQILRNESEDITPEYPELKKLIEDMWTTLAEAEGVTAGAEGVVEATTEPAVEPQAEENANE